MKAGFTSLWGKAAALPKKAISSNLASTPRQSGNIEEEKVSAAVSKPKVKIPKPTIPAAPHGRMVNSHPKLRQAQAI